MTPACIYVDKDGKRYVVSQIIADADGQPSNVKVVRALFASSDAQGNTKYTKTTVFKADQQD